MAERDPDSQGASGMHNHPQLRIAAGISDFVRLRQGRKYYVDKTSQLAALLSDDSGPLLLTRPRRFGKTLTMDTLRRFLELDYQNPGDTARQRELFAGLKIMEDPALQVCRERFMGQHPVVALSFNTVEGESFEQALTALRTLVYTLFKSFEPQLQSARLTAADRMLADTYMQIRLLNDQEQLLSLIRDAPLTLAELLYRIYSRPVYILIDEYDTPLAKAWSAEPASAARPESGKSYYSSMITLLRALLHPLLKPAPALQEAIGGCLLTGCTRVSRESIFTGMNNLQVLGPGQRRCTDLMGFTQEEVQSMLSYYGLTEYLAAVEEWYDGYRFAGMRIYNPWSIARYCQAAVEDGITEPDCYWIHSSGNDVLAHCLHELPGSDLERLQQLCAGQRVVLPIREDLSYAELLGSRDSAGLFTLLYHTGYLTEDDDGTLEHGRAEQVMRIPNAEVQECFAKQILGMYDFAQTARARPAHQLITAFITGDAPAAEQHLTWLLQRFLSFQILGPRSQSLKELRKLIAPLHNPRLELLLERVSTDLPERIYHLLVFGLLCGMDNQSLISLDMDREFGGGRPDISFVWACRMNDEPQIGCILEFKAASGTQDSQLLAAAAAGLQQIRERDYALGLYAHYPDLTRVWAYGLGCRGKCCAVSCELIPQSGKHLGCMRQEKQDGH